MRFTPEQHAAHAQRISQVQHEEAELFFSIGCLSTATYFQRVSADSAREARQWMGLED
jgi:hypothetical protein